MRLKLNGWLVFWLILTLCFLVFCSDKTRIIKIDLFDLSDRGVYIGQNIEELKVKGFQYDNSCECYGYVGAWNELFHEAVVKTDESGRVQSIHLYNPEFATSASYNENAKSIVDSISKLYGEYNNISDSKFLPNDTVSIPLISWTNDSLGYACLTFTPDTYMEHSMHSYYNVYFAAQVFEDSVLDVPSARWNAENLGLK